MNKGAGTILRVDLTNNRISTESTDTYRDRFIGGRGINVKIAFDEINPEISPFEPDNRLMFGPGVFAGTPVPAASRMEVTTMLPNGLIGSSGIGGFIGAEIKHAGYDNIVIQGKSDNPVYILIRDDSVEIKDASHLWGLDTWETQQTIKEEVNDPDVQILCIGPAGENQVSFSCILTGNYSAAGHGGAGAIMGSKNLKAIAVRGHQPVKIAKMDEFLEACHLLRASIINNPVRQMMKQSGDSFAVPGTLMAGIAVFGNWEDADWDSSQGQEVQEEAKGFWSHYDVGSTVCFGCPISHTRILTVPEVGTGGPKCEAWGAFSTRVWNTDHKLIFQAGHLCNLLGLDVGSTSNAVAFLMELYHKGIISIKDTDGIAMERGDAKAIVTAIENIAHQKGFGKLFRDGVVEAAKTIGKGAEEFAIHVKGSELYGSMEMRGFKMRALASALCRKAVDAIATPEPVTIEGREAAEKLAEELCGSKKAANPDGYEMKGRLVWEMENRCTVADIFGICRHYDAFGVGKPLNIASKIYPLITGVDLSESNLLIAAQRVRTLERAFSCLRGFRRRDDTLPKRLLENTVSGGPMKGKRIDRNKFDQMIGEYYELSGWDQDGMPQKETFKKLGLTSEWQRFNKALKRIKPNHN